MQFMTEVREMGCSYLDWFNLCWECILDAGSAPRAVFFTFGMIVVKSSGLIRRIISPLGSKKCGQILEDQSRGCSFF